MKKFITENGFEAYTYQEMLQIVKEIYISSFGIDDIDFSSNTVAGQVVNNQTQFIIDLISQMQDIYNLVLSRETATGVNLDFLGSYYSIPRKQGTYSTQEIEIVSTSIVLLQGLDGNINTPAFQISTAEGVNFALSNSAFLQIGTNTLIFQALEQGPVNVLPNTLTNIVTVQNGISSVNNPQAQLTVGTLEETDGEYRVRQNRSLAINSIGFKESIEANLRNTVENVTNVIILENASDTTDSDGLTPHSIKVIVEGGSDADIATTIDRAKPPGTGTNGSVVVQVPQPSGRTTEIKFERGSSLPLYIIVDLKNNTTIAIDVNAFKTAYISNVFFELNQTAETGDLTCILVDTLKTLGLDAYVFNMQISENNQNFVNFLPTPQPSNKWSLVNANITINLI